MLFILPAFATGLLMGGLSLQGWGDIMGLY
jgi:hypothetical protein